ERDGDRGGERDRPAQLALGLAAPRGQRVALPHNPGRVVQPYTRVSAVRGKALLHQVVQLVDPVVQRPDLGNDLRRRGAALRPLTRFVVSYARHSNRLRAAPLRRPLEAARPLSAEYRRSHPPRGRGPRRAGLACPPPCRRAPAIRAGRRAGRARTGRARLPSARARAPRSCCDAPPRAAWSAVTAPRPPGRRASAPRG